MRAFYDLGRIFCRFVRFNCIPWQILHRERAELPGGYVLACTHLGNLEPILLGTLMQRRIDYLSRIEFFRHRLAAKMLYALDAIPLDRQGVPVRAIRTAIQRVRNGRIVGIFPEGNVKQKMAAAIRGGPIKGGACLVALHAAAPVVPVVVLGADQLNRVGPFLPWRRARIWMNFGLPIFRPPDQPHRRTARQMMSRQLAQSFQALYRELCAAYAIDDAAVP